jgi:hypothetical protein
MSANLSQDVVVVETSKAVLQALFELRMFQSSHGGGEVQNQNVEALATLGAISRQTIGCFANRQIQFHGFPNRISRDTAVLEVEVADRIPPLRIIGFADGHVECVTVD